MCVSQKLKYVAHSMLKAALISSWKNLKSFATRLRHSLHRPPQLKIPPGREEWECVEIPVAGE